MLNMVLDTPLISTCAVQYENRRLPSGTYFRLTLPTIPNSDEQIKTYLHFAAQKMKFFIKNFFNKCDQIRCGFGHIY